MPKIINNLEDKIFKSALQLFAENKYENVSMKNVAKNAGIAVGTLYNHYSNKKELFLEVYKIRLDSLSKDLKTILNKKEDVNEFITFLYDEILKISGFSEEIIRSTIIKHDKDKILNQLKSDVISTIKDVISNYKAKENRKFLDEYEERIITLVLFSIIYLGKDYPEEREKNIAFISEYINKLLE